MRNVERQVLLTALDRNWRAHLYEMDYLKEGIGLRAMAQRNPLVEYKEEGYKMFQAMNDAIRSETVSFLMGFELPSEKAAREAAQAESGQAPIAGAGVGVRLATPAAKAETQASNENTAASAGNAPTAGKGGSAHQASIAAEKVLGLKRPSAVQMTYTSSAKDGSGTSRATNERGDQVNRQMTAGAPTMNRAQRRAAEKKKKK